MTSPALTTATPKQWWQWQPVTPGETVLYLLVMAIFSGFFSVLLNRLFGVADPWAHFLPGAIFSVVLNAITLWVKRHPHHSPRTADVPR